VRNERSQKAIERIGADCLDGRPQAFYVNNPSRRRAELQASARLPLERFAAAYSGRIIVIGQTKIYL
jgi:hypothetical protein